MATNCKCFDCVCFNLRWKMTTTREDWWKPLKQHRQLSNQMNWKRRWTDRCLCECDLVWIIIITRIIWLFHLNWWGFLLIFIEKNRFHFKKYSSFDLFDICLISFRCCPKKFDVKTSLRHSKNCKICFFFSKRFKSIVLLWGKNVFLRFEWQNSKSRKRFAFEMCVSSDETLLQKHSHMFISKQIEILLLFHWIMTSLMFWQFGISGWKKKFFFAKWMLSCFILKEVRSRKSVLSFHWKRSLLVDLLKMEKKPSFALAKKQI